MRLSIVIPTLDEAQGLRGPLRKALAEADEVCVSDGGSRDGTVALAESLGARVVTGPPGRGGQLNRGASATQGDVLLFLHADTELPDQAAETIRQALDTGAVGGGFSLRFAGQHRTMDLFAANINRRTRLTQCPLGDQAHFVRRQVFEDLGGYRDWPILEDLDFARRLKQAGPVTVLEPPVVTSPRRYLERGPWRTVATNWLLFALFGLGVPPRRLGHLYRHIR